MKPKGMQAVNVTGSSPPCVIEFFFALLLGDSARSTLSPPGPQPRSLCGISMVLACSSHVPQVLRIPLTDLGLSVRLITVLVPSHGLTSHTGCLPSTPCPYIGSWIVDGFFPLLGFDLH